MSALGEIGEQLDELIRTASRMRDAVAAGGSPDLADARILRGQAQCTEHLVELERIGQLRTGPLPSAEQDADAQRVMAREHNGYVDCELAKWSAA